jgi:hypothetical protein
MLEGNIYFPAAQIVIPGPAALVLPGSLLEPKNSRLGPDFLNQSLHFNDTQVIGMLIICES